MGDRALADIGDDFHLLMRVGRKARVGSDLIVVPHAQAPVTHALGIVIAGKRKVLLGFAAMARRHAGIQFDHRNLHFDSRSLRDAAVHIRLAPVMKLAAGWQGRQPLLQPPPGPVTAKRRHGLLPWRVVSAPGYVGVDRARLHIAPR
jgi:hypothetical protein